MANKHSNNIFSELQDVLDPGIHEDAYGADKEINAVARRVFYRKHLGELVVELELEDLSPSIDVLVFKQDNGFWGSEYTLATCGLSDVPACRGYEILLRLDDTSIPSQNIEDSAQFRYLERALSHLVDNPCDPMQAFPLDGVEFPEKEDGLYSHAITIPTRHELDEVRIGIVGRRAIAMLDIEFITDEEAVYADAQGVRKLLQLMREYDHSHYFRLYRQNYGSSLQP